MENIVESHLVVKTLYPNVLESGYDGWFILENILGDILCRYRHFKTGYINLNLVFCFRLFLGVILHSNLPAKALF